MFFTAFVLQILIKLKMAKQYTENLIAKFQNLNFHLFWVSLIGFEQLGLGAPL